jgi:hypothetical protein
MQDARTPSKLPLPLPSVVSMAGPQFPGPHSTSGDLSAITGAGRPGNTLFLAMGLPRHAYLGGSAIRYEISPVLFSTHLRNHYALYSSCIWILGVTKETQHHMCKFTVQEAESLLMTDSIHSRYDLRKQHVSPHALTTDQ